jgi:hypothetical protein
MAHHLASIRTGPDAPDHTHSEHSSPNDKHDGVEDIDQVALQRLGHPRDQWGLNKIIPKNRFQNPYHKVKGILESCRSQAVRAHPVQANGLRVRYAGREPGYDEQRGQG